MRKEPVLETVSTIPQVLSQNPGALYIERALAQASVINTSVHNVFSHTDPLSLTQALPPPIVKMQLS